MAAGHPQEGAGLVAEDLRDAWDALDVEERLEGFRMLPPDEAEMLLDGLEARDHCTLLLALSPAERQLWMRRLAPDDAADAVQAAPPEGRETLMAALDAATRREVSALLAYAEDAAGGLMSPRYVPLRPDMTVDEAVSYLRRAARERVETIYYIYVIDAEQHLLGVISFRDLFAAQPEARVRDVMRTHVISVREDLDQEAVANVIAENNLMAVPVLDAAGRIRGIVTVDDIVDVVREEATEDIQKIGGPEALDAPYLEVGVLEMVRKRGGWLSVLFAGQLLTAATLSLFESELARAVVLSLFIPLVISSGGNAGSQASTLVIRAMAMQEVRLHDWWRVMRRELAAGLVLGLVLGGIALVSIALWPRSDPVFGGHFLAVGLTVAVSLLWIVVWGAVSGGMLPFVLERMGFDPASASAPLVTTLVDVTGLLIYFSVASIVLAGTLL
ncbi:MAG: magnesium transporter [Myxococcota bacterium]